MMGWMRALVAACTLAAGWPTAGLAQAGVTPLLTGPDALDPGRMQIGGYVTIEDELDLFGIYRRAIGSTVDFGARAGFTDAAGGGLHLGGDLRFELQRASPDFPFDIAVVGGLQLTFADNADLVVVPIGVSLGRQLGSPQTPVTLYGAPHLRVQRVDPDIGPGSDTELELSVEFGGQVRVAPALWFEGALTLASDDDDNVALGLGLAWRR